MPERDDLPFVFLVRLRGRAKPFAAIRYVCHHTGLRADHGLISNFQVTGHTRLSREYNVVADFGAARDADLRDDDAMFADLHVVRDLH